MTYRANIRPKRAPGTVTHFQERIVVPMPLTTKNVLRRVARENDVGQGELGFLVLVAAFANTAFLAGVLEEDRERKRKARRDAALREKRC